MAVKAGWYPVPGYEDRYEIHTSGRVRTIQGWAKGRELKLQRSSSVKVYLNGADGKMRTITLAKLMYQTFYGPVPDGFRVLHRNGEKTDNSVGNLCIGTMNETTGPMTAARERHVLKTDRGGVILDCYKNFKEAAEANYLGSGTLWKRLHHKLRAEPRILPDVVFWYEDEVRTDEDFTRVLGFRKRGDSK